MGGRTHRADRPADLARGHPGDRLQRTTAFRRPAQPVRRRGGVQRTPGSNSSSSPKISWRGHNACASSARSPSLNPNDSVAALSTPPRPSRTPAARPSSGSSTPGPGPATSSPPANGSASRFRAEHRTRRARRHASDAHPDTRQDKRRTPRSKPLTPFRCTHRATPTTAPIRHARSPDLSGLPKGPG